MHKQDYFDWLKGKTMDIEDRKFYGSSLHKQYNILCGWVAVLAFIPILILLIYGFTPSPFYFIYAGMLTLMIFYLQNRVLKLKNRIIKGDFKWRIGYVDDAKKDSKNHSKYVIADGAYCNTYESIRRFDIGDEIMIIKLDKAVGTAFVKN